MKTFSCLACLLVAVGTAQAQSSMEAMPNYTAESPEASGISSPIFSSINGPVGWTFQPLTDMDVTALGAFSYVVPSKGKGSLEIGLWDSSGMLLASETVSAASTTVGQSLYQAIAPVLLTAGQTYFLAAYYPAGVLQAVAVTPNTSPNGSATMSPEIQLGVAAYSSGAGFTFPSTQDGYAGCAIIAPNFEFQPVPEPALLFPLGATIAGLLVWRRRGAIGSGKP